VTLTLLYALVSVGKTGAHYDRAAERLIAHAAAAADLRAPSAQVARVKAERVARTRAEAKLSSALDHLGADLDKDELEKAVSAATIENERYGSDGSVELDLVLSTHGLKLGR
jgi:hypothetical protein